MKVIAASKQANSAGCRDEEDEDEEDEGNEPRKPNTACCTTSAVTSADYCSALQVFGDHLVTVIKAQSSAHQNHTQDRGTAEPHAATTVAAAQVLLLTDTWRAHGDCSQEQTVVHTRGTLKTQ